MPQRGLRGIWRTRPSRPRCSWLLRPHNALRRPATWPDRTAGSPMPLAPGAGAPGATIAPARLRPRSRSPKPFRSAGGTRGAGRLRPLRPRRAADQRRPDLARLCGEAGRHRRLSPDQRGQGGRADLRAAARQLRRARQPRTGQRRQGGAAARRNGPRSLRNSRRRHPARGPRRRRAYSHRANIVRHFHRQPVRHHRAPADRAERA